MKIKTYIYPIFFGTLFFLLSPQTLSAQTLSPQGVADISRPAVVQVGTHIQGTAAVPAVAVDIRARTVTLIPESKKEIDINEYFSGSGFVITQDGFIATNAHVVSENTIKQKLATERALQSLYENALSLSDAEMETLLKEGKNGFIQEVLRVILQESTFNLTKEVRILVPNRAQMVFTEAFTSGELAEVLVESPNFLSGGADIALLRLTKVPAPALALAEKELSVGDRVYIAGFPSTAEIGALSSGEVTFTAGVVSAIRITPEGRKLYQTDAKISEGSSGGPVLNEEGKIVGMVTFQTDEIERRSGDNFAFAQEVQTVRDFALASRIEPREGMYAESFRKGFEAYVERRCQDMEEFFLKTDEIDQFFGIERSLATYQKDCALWQANGEVNNGGQYFLQRNFLLNRNSFWWLFLGSFIFIGTIIILILWLFRQLQRDEIEIQKLEQRIVQDETEILKQRRESHQWFLEHDQSKEHSVNKESKG